ncbi:MAG: hypothetical protein F6K25_32020 [Okeania sp. SIO2G4]|uniref:hypothetical protein n=1 Tax=unclassified Okeania TaxID=2634635 RepID=UPI0013BCD1A7|nr:MULTISPECIES: hypothetical protein [unclassified Okeania]NEP76093.1 hypothetical protein [Okeania sp. SIO2G5]NEP97272.1 hypothetical protein [Okeania sp. SIO2F5]NEQ94994.1 hypothetical protein [Okeania sp. SIO2G4]
MGTGRINCAGDPVPHESRLGLITLWARKLTSRGVQPVAIEQWCFDYLWLYGLVEPETGESFFAEFSHVDGFAFSST